MSNIVQSRNGIERLVTVLITKESDSFCLGPDVGTISRIYENLIESVGLALDFLSNTAAHIIWSGMGLVQKCDHSISHELFLGSNY